ncbi:MAG: signal peptidase I [Candidatus Baldrarchaeia archaeon]
MVQSQEKSKTVKEIVEVVVIILILIGGVYGIDITLKYMLRTSKPVVVVEGVSMQPTLHEGDILIVKGVDPEDIKIGDIIVFESSESTPHISPNRTVVHRVIDIKYDEKQGQYLYLTKGDNNKTNPIPDGWVPYKDVYGKVIFRIPRVGIISIWLRRTHLGPIIIGVLVVIMIVLTIWETPEEEQESKEK